MWVLNGQTTELPNFNVTTTGSARDGKGGVRRYVHSQRSSTKTRHVRSKCLTVTTWVVKPTEEHQTTRTFGPVFFLVYTIMEEKFIYIEPCRARFTEPGGKNVNFSLLKTCWREAYLCTAASCRFVFSQFRLWTLPDRKPPCCWWKWYQILEASPWLRSATRPLCVSQRSEEAMLLSHLLPRAP